MYIPLPRIILLPYRLIVFLIRSILQWIGYSERDKQVLRWLAETDDPMRPQDYEVKYADQLMAAIETAKPVYIEYAEKENKITSRTVVPEKLFRRGDHIYVEAYCLKRKEYRRFRLDRIKYLQ
jgi:predicted DNA-binding transcriptional regulator YafY